MYVWTDSAEKYYSASISKYGDYVYYPGGSAGANLVILCSS